MALLCIGVGTYLLVLEAVRILSNFWSSDFALIAPAIFSLTCLVCSLVIASGISLLLFSREPIKLGLVVACALAGSVLEIPILIYLPYFIPYATGPSYTASDWSVLALLVGFAAFCVSYSIFLILRLRSAVRYACPLGTMRGD